MDVRCEKCHTEYELEDAKVTEAGVTVKCTSCGNLFKIKRRTALPPPRPADAPPDGGVMWVIRSPGGEHRRFKELTTLQQWIVERKVTRECEISRSGETWKRLGDIAELSAFFAIVDQAQGSGGRPAAVPDRKATQPMAPSTVSPARPVAAPSVPVPILLQSQPLPVAPPVVLNDKPVEFAQTAHVRPSRPDPVPERRASASWAGAAVAAPADADDPDAGDSDNGDEPAWAKGKGAPLKAPDRSESPSFEMPGLPIQEHGGGARTMKVSPGGFGDYSDYDAFQPRRPSRTWMYVSGAVLAFGALGAFLLLRGHGQTEAAVGPQTPAPVVQPGPGPTPPAPTPAAVDAGVAPADKAYADALARIAEDTDEAFTAAEKLLDGARVADPAKDARVAAAAAALQATMAQNLLDDAALATDPKVAEQARAESARRLQKAEKLAHEAEGKAAQAPEVLVAAADVARLSKKSAADIDKKLAAAGESADVLYVRGMTRWRDGKGAEAAELLNGAVAARAKEGGQHLRALYRLAVIALDDKKTDEAKTHLEAILSAQPGHARARALAARLTAPPVAVTPTPPAPTPTPTPTAPMPPTPTEKPPVAAADLGTGPISAGAYGGLVSKGDKLAENGDCNGAMRYYERALDARPGGVEALTGLGYCHLDRKDYSHAISNFRAALGISSRYTEALIGIAEAYKFQGMNEEALTYYRRYLEQAPNGSKAAMARRMVESLAPTAAPEKPPEQPKPEPTSPPPVDRLPDKPGAPTEAAPETPPPAPEPAPPTHADEKPPEPKPEPAPEPPPPSHPADPGAPDSPKQ